MGVERKALRSVVMLERTKTRGSDNMLNRTRAWRRAQNRRTIRRRQNIVKNCWRDKSYNKDVPGGIMRKWNFTCDCGTCKMDKYFGVQEKRRRELAKASKSSDYC
jgi:hypothetical protein